MKVIQRAWRGGSGQWRMQLLSTLSSAVAFVCLAFALLVVVNLRAIEARWQSAGHVSAYLSGGAATSEAERLVLALRASPGVAKARFVSSEDSRGELLSTTSDVLLPQLPGDAFPASVEVTFSETAAPERASEVAAQLRSLRNVESVETYRAWTDRLSKLANAATIVAAFLSLIVLLAVTTVVSSTTKLMLEKRRDEVEVLRIVGATREYVRRPFMFEGAVQGALGAISALLFCGLTYAFLSTRVDQLATLVGMAPRFLPWSASLSLVAAGAVLGGAAAALSLRKSYMV